MVPKEFRHLTAVARIDETWIINPTFSSSSHVESYVTDLPNGLRDTNNFIHIRSILCFDKKLHAQQYSFVLLKEKCQ
jgi:hypothetical protein